MRQRREDARNIALIAGSGALGAAAALVGISLMGSTAEVSDLRDLRLRAPAWEVREMEVRPDRFRAELSFRRTERPAELHRVYRVRMLQEKAVAETLKKEVDRSSDLRELQVGLQAELAALEARLEEIRLGASDESGLDLEAAVTRAARVGADGAGSAGAPAVYVDGVRFNGPMEDLDPHEIGSVEVIKGDAAIEKYGKDGKNGVIVIIRKRKPGKKRQDGDPR